MWWRIRWWINRRLEERHHRRLMLGLEKLHDIDTTSRHWKPYNSGEGYGGYMIVDRYYEQQRNDLLGEEDDAAQ